MSLWSKSTEENTELTDEPGLCRFSGCDDDATETIGTVALCALHRSYVEVLLDSGDPPADTIDMQACITLDGATGVR